MCLVKCGRTMNKYSIFVLRREMFNYKQYTYNIYTYIYIYKANGNWANEIVVVANVDTIILTVNLFFSICKTAPLAPTNTKHYFNVTFRDAELRISYNLACI